MKHVRSLSMKRWIPVLMVLLLWACQEEIGTKQAVKIDLSVEQKVRELGFSTSGMVDLGEFISVEGDILLKKDKLDQYLLEVEESIRGTSKGRTEHIRVASLINLANQRNITVFVDPSIPVGGDDDWRPELAQAVADINSIPHSRIRMQIVTTAPADIVIRDDAGQLNDGSWVWGGSGWVWVWTLAQASWPINGNAGPEIIINLNADNNRVLTTGQKRHNITHELGHCVGLRHTNWSSLGESSGIAITGTPNSGSNPDPNSVMNGGTALNTWAGFSVHDRTAFSSTYPSMRVTVAGPAKGNNSGTYTWSASTTGGISPYTYSWLYSINGGQTYSPFGSGTSITAQLPLDRSLWLRITGTASDGETGVTEHFTMNLDEEP